MGWKNKGDGYDITNWDIHIDECNCYVFIS